METEVIKINSKKIERKVVEKAALFIKKGELVAFPTETVYGLGANAFNARAVRKIFKAKKRPADNPLIVHIGDKETLRKIAREIPEKAVPLMKKFWPGPLTLVFKKTKKIPYVVTGGGETVAVRMPSHPIALELIRKSMCPIAAPSANTSTRPSSTRASHVRDDFDGVIPLILDGGKTNIGVESTVLDLSSLHPTLLRKGEISRTDLEKVIGKIYVHTNKKNGIVKSPGQKYRHYAPKAFLILAQHGEKSVNRALRVYKNKKVFVITFSERKKSYPSAEETHVWGAKGDVVSAAKKFFEIVRECDKKGADVIIVEKILEKGVGEALMDRISRSASKII